MTLDELINKNTYGYKENSLDKYLDEDTNVFIASKRAEDLLNEYNAEDTEVIENARKAIYSLKLYETKLLKEEYITDISKKITIADICRALNESIYALEEMTTKEKNSFNPEPLLEAYSSLLFKAQMLGEEVGEPVGDLNIVNDNYREYLERDFAKIVEEVF